MMKCSVDGCLTEHTIVRSFCRKHYARAETKLKKTGIDDFPPRITVSQLESDENLYKIYHIWRGMKARCNNPNNKAYKNYGGRGIKVCDRWQHNFYAFYTDMGDKPSSKHSIDRIDNDSDYEPSNCRWATWKVQANNKRSRKSVTT